MDKNKIIAYIEDLNKTEVIKIQNSDKTRRIFKQSDKVFDIFGAENKSVLNPFNNYTYEWLNSFLNSVKDFINSEDFEDFDELSEKISEVLPEWIDGEVSVYTSDLTEWLNDNNSNVYYLTEANEEYGNTDGFKNLQIAQYIAIEEVYNNALNCLIDDLKVEFDEE
jgi:hypothetical protein